MPNFSKHNRKKSPTELGFHNGRGTFGCHEALHVTSVALALIDRELCSHLAIVQNPEWYAFARSAQNELAALYQRISATHLGEDSPTQ